MLAGYGPDACVELGAVVLGLAVGREAEDQITVADLTGLGVQGRRHRQRDTARCSRQGLRDDNRVLTHSYR